jgi:hypothetical protein
MKFAYRLGLLLAVNVTIVSSAVLPGIAESIEPTIAQAERSVTLGNIASINQLGSSRNLPLFDLNYNTKTL